MRLAEISVSSSLGEGMTELLANVGKRTGIPQPIRSAASSARGRVRGSISLRPPHGVTHISRENFRREREARDDHFHRGGGLHIEAVHRARPFKAHGLDPHRRIRKAGGIDAVHGAVNRLGHRVIAQDQRIVPSQGGGAGHARPIGAMGMQRPGHDRSLRAAAQAQPQFTKRLKVIGEHRLRRTETNRNSRRTGDRVQRQPIRASGGYEWQQGIGAEIHDAGKRHRPIAGRCFQRRHRFIRIERGEAKRPGRHLPAARRHPDYGGARRFRSDAGEFGARGVDNHGIARRIQPVAAVEPAKRIPEQDVTWS